MGSIWKLRMKKKWCEWVRKFSATFPDFPKLTSSRHEPKCVIHFYHSKFKRCEIMDKHLAVSWNKSPALASYLTDLQKLAPKYFNTRFLRVFVENIPWLVEKLSIKVLPCVICFVDGVTKDRYVVFAKLDECQIFTDQIGWIWGVG